MITIYFGPKVAFEKVIPNNSKKNSWIDGINKTK